MDPLTIQNHKQWLNDPVTKQLIAWLDIERSRYLRCAVGYAMTVQEENPQQSAVINLVSYKVVEDCLKSIQNPYLGTGTAAQSSETE